MTREDFLKNLKPCPFCGSPANIVEITHEARIGISRLRVECHCGVSVEIDVHENVYYDGFEGEPFLISADALTIWNTRADAQEVTT